LRWGINRRFDRANLLGDKVWIEEGKTVPRSLIASGPRIGIDYAEEWVEKPWRFWIRDIRTSAVDHEIFPGRPPDLPAQPKRPANSG